jgi:hypothetical protein
MLQDAANRFGKLTAHWGKELKLCAETNAARNAVPIIVRENMANA